MNTRMGLFIIALAIVPVALIPSFNPNKPANAIAECTGSHDPGFEPACNRGHDDHEQCKPHEYGNEDQYAYDYGWYLIPDSHCP
ncbi:MAG: hypothetical protein ACJ72R_05785 [Nitrososphaeraceae archaeon]